MLVEDLESLVTETKSKKQTLQFFPDLTNVTRGCVSALKQMFQALWS